MEAPLFDALTALGLPSQVLLSVVGASAVYVAYREAIKALAKGRNEPPLDLGLPLLGKTLDLSGDVWKFTKGKKGLWQTNIFGYNNVSVVQSCENSEKIYRGEGKNISYWFPPHVAHIIGERALICTVGPTHKKLRAALTACFQPSVLRLISEPVQEIANEYLTDWSNDGVFDAGSDPFKVSFGIGTSFVGLHTMKMTEERRTELINKTFTMNYGMVSYPVDLGRFSTFGRGKIASEEIREEMDTVIRERRELTRKSDAAGEPRPDDVLQRLLDFRDEDGIPMSDDILRENMCFFISAAFETTAATLTGFLTCMCRFPEVQDRAYEHIRDVLGEDSEEFLGTKPISAERWNDFEYIEQVIREAERFIPPIVNSSWRQAARDFELGGFSFKKGMKFFVNSMERCVDPIYWERPEKFEPERFGPLRLEHKRGLGKNNKLNTFGGGTRECLGKPLANFQRKIFAVLALRDYKFSLVDKEPPMTYNLAIRLEEKFPMKIERRRK